MFLRGLDAGKRAMVRIFPLVSMSTFQHALDPGADVPQDAGGACDKLSTIGARSPRSSPTTEELVTSCGLPCETHRVLTPDGYGICLHRIPQSGKPVVLMWHGLMMSSEIWVCSPDRELSLAFELSKRGYDVWLGNSRGNKYSREHTSLERSSKKYWDFSIDEIAKYDFPSSVNFILSNTGMSTLAYVAFSQGSTQGFASLSRNAELGKKISIFIALSPAAKPSNFPNKLLSTVVNVSPESLYTIIGERGFFLGGSSFWKRVLPAPTYAAVIGFALQYIFGWKNELGKDREVIYGHLCSQSSVKQVVHWLQIIRKARFQEYENPPGAPPEKAQEPEEYHISNITTPIALFYGKKDKIVDIDWFTDRIKNLVASVGIDEYEHLCLLWDKGLKTKVYPAIFQLLEKHAQYNEQTHTDISIVSDSRKLLSG